MKLMAATDRDFEFVRRVHHAAYREVVVRQFGEWDEAAQDGFFERVWSGGPRYVIEDDGERCGYCAVEREDDGMMLRELVLLPEHQGRRLGTRVIVGLIEEAAAEGMPLRLNVLRSNTRARSLYERLGFRWYGESETHDFMRWETAGARDADDGRG